MLTTLAICGVFMACLGAWSIGGWVFHLRKALRSTEWPQVTGKILASDIYEGELDDDEHTVTTNYEYHVDGVRYVSDRVSFRPRVKSSNLDIVKQAAVRYRPKGREVSVYYYPENPAFSVLEPGVRFYDVWSGLFFLSLGAASVVIYFEKIE